MFHIYFSCMHDHHYQPHWRRDIMGMDDGPHLHYCMIMRKATREMKDRWRCQKNVITPCQLFLASTNLTLPPSRPPHTRQHSIPPPCCRPPCLRESQSLLLHIRTYVRSTITTIRLLCSTPPTRRQPILSSDYHFAYLFDWISLSKST